MYNLFSGITEINRLTSMTVNIWMNKYMEMEKLEK